MTGKMTETESQTVVTEINSALDILTTHSESAQTEAFLGCYHNAPEFLAFGGDGQMRNFDEYKKICIEYYTSLKEQKLVTIHKKFNVIDANHVIAGWTGNIDALFRNGDRMIMNNYSVTYVFRKIKDQWKIIHSHESSLPPEVTRK